MHLIIIGSLDSYIAIHVWRSPVDIINSKTSIFPKTFRIFNRFWKSFGISHSPYSLCPPQHVILSYISKSENYWIASINYTAQECCRPLLTSLTFYLSIWSFSGTLVCPWIFTPQQDSFFLRLIEQEKSYPDFIWMESLKSVGTASCPKVFSPKHTSAPPLLAQVWVAPTLTCLNWFLIDLGTDCLPQHVS